MRCSDWRIVWNPAGESPRVLLDFDDEMEGEIVLPWEQLVGRIRSDFAPSTLPVSRANVRRRLEFTRRDEHPTAAESFEACSAELLADPWEKGVMSIEPRGATSRNFVAALMTASHEPLSGYPNGRSLHGYTFRVARTTVSVWVPDGDPIPIIGGVRNPGGTIVVTLPPGHGVEPGQEVEIHYPGTPPVPRPVIGVDGNSVTLGGDDEPDALELDEMDQWIDFSPGDGFHRARRDVKFALHVSAMPSGVGQWSARITDATGGGTVLPIVGPGNFEAISRTFLIVEHYFFQDHLEGRTFTMGTASSEEFSAPNPDAPEFTITWSYTTTAPTEITVEFLLGGVVQRTVRFTPKFSAPMHMVFGAPVFLEQDSDRVVDLSWTGGSVGIPASAFDTTGSDDFPVGTLQRIREEQQ